MAVQYTHTKQIRTPNDRPLLHRYFRFGNARQSP
jgi:hypothetical protein